MNKRRRYKLKRRQRENKFQRDFMNQVRSWVKEFKELSPQEFAAQVQGSWDARNSTPLSIGSAPENPSRINY
jgi:hypothetical protein